MEISPVAIIRNDLTGKFGIPRQSGIVGEIKSKIIFEPPFRDPSAVRGLEEFSHLWLLWHFSQNKDVPLSLTVRPPRLGGNVRMGVFATRSPYRPNPIGLSPVKLEKIEYDGTFGPILHVLGADLMDNTPILDIKPYIPYSDSILDAVGGFASSAPEPSLTVHFEPSASNVLSPDAQQQLSGILQFDPRPRYQDDPERVYGMSFGRFEVKFRIIGKCLTVISIE